MEYLVYSRLATSEGEAPRAELWRMALDASDQLRFAELAANSWITGLSIAPDGTQLALSEDVAVIGTGGLDPPTKLQLIREPAISSPDWAPSNGARVLTLVEGDLTLAEHAFAPDGAHLAFEQRDMDEDGLLNGSLWVVATDGGAARQVTPAYRFSVSAPAWLDSEHLIYSSAQIPNVFTQTLRISIQPGAQPEPVFDGAFEALSPDRTMMLALMEPIGTNIAVTQRFPYALVSLASPTTEVIHEWELPVGRFAWSPDGTILAQTDVAGALRVLNLSDGSIEELKQINSRYETIANLTWEPGSRGLFYIFDNRNAGPVASQEFELYRWDLAAGTEQLLMTMPADGSIDPIRVPPAPRGAN
jgi:hypothetical protein